MGYYLDGRVTALLGTHTHVQTADAQILPEGTAYITDVGMTGPKESVLGIEPKLAIKKMKYHIPVRFQNAEGRHVMNACLIDVDEKTGKSTYIKRVVLK
jgi:calcineurin-like phosphoesterase